jgi:hypothetical protein
MPELIDTVEFEVPLIKIDKTFPYFLAGSWINQNTIDSCKCSPPT